MKSCVLEKSPRRHSTTTPTVFRVVLGLLIAFSLTTMGCNLYGKLDNPGDVQDKYAAGIALANAGLCSDARDVLKTIANPSDDVAVALGWAHLCVGGATASNIATSLYKFTSGGTDLTGIGVLARSMLPITGSKSDALSEAINVFSGVRDLKRRSLQVAIAQFSLAAGILGGQAGNDGEGTLVRTDVSVAACVSDAATCATTTNCTTGMTAADVTRFTNAIAAAASSLAVTGAGDLTALANALNSGIIGAGNPARCFIFNQTVPST